MKILETTIFAKVRTPQKSETISKFILHYLVSSKKLGDLKKNLAFSEYFRISSMEEGCIFIQTLILFWGKLKPSPNKSALLLNIKLI